MSVEMPYEITSLECITHQIKIKVIWMLKQCALRSPSAETLWLTKLDDFCLLPSTAQLNYTFLLWHLGFRSVIMSDDILEELSFVSLICLKKHKYEWTFPLFFTLVCVWSHREPTVRQWWVCCQERLWVRMVSSCQSLYLRSTCPGCGWRNTRATTARSVCRMIIIIYE